MIQDILERASLWTGPIESAFEASIPDENPDASGTCSDVEANGPSSVLREPDRSLNTGTPSHSSSATQSFNIGRTSSTCRTPELRPSTETDIVDAENVVATARTWSLVNVSIVGLPSDRSALSGSENASQAPTSPSPLSHGFGPRTPIGSPTPKLINVTWSRRDLFDVSTMRAALPTSTPMRSRGSDHPSAGYREQEIGYRGELSIFGILQNELEASEACWTSKMRSRHDLSPFTGIEAEHSDFTIPEPEPETASRFTRWLLDKGVGAASEWLTTNMVYHLEVKTTIGELVDPFMMSNNQMILAQTWHVQPSHVYIILRVDHLNAECDVDLFVDPYALMLAGKLKVTAPGGSHVQAMGL